MLLSSCRTLASFPNKSPIDHRALLLILAGALLCIFPYLHTSEVFQVSEGREGVVVNAILEQEEWILPLRHGSVVPSKPPLFHWIGASAAALLERNDEFVLRLPSALAATGVLIAVGMFARAIAAPIVGILASGILLSCYGFVRMAADGRVDMLLTFFVVAAILRWVSAYLKLRRDGVELPSVSSRVWLETATLCGLGMLAKGPLGLALPVWVIASILLLEHGPRALRLIFRLEWCAAIALAAPWYALATLRGQDSFLSRQMVFENLQRFVGGEGITPKPPWFYLTQFWAHGAPWSVCLAICAVVVVRRRIKVAEPRALLIRVNLIWLLSMVLLFSLSTGKRRAYLLPTLPAMAFVLATYFELMIERARTVDAYSRWFVGAWAVLGVVAFVLYVGGWTVPLDGEKGARTVRAWLEVLETDWALWVGTIGVLFPTSVLLWRRAAETNAPRLAAGAVFLLLQFAFLGLVNPLVAIKGVTHGFKEWSEIVASRLEPGESLTFVKRLRDESFDGFFFYFGRQVALAPRTELPTSRGAYLARHEWFDLTPAEWRSAVEIVAEGGRQADEPSERIVMFRIREKPPTPPFDFEEPLLSGKGEEGGGD